MKPRDWFRWVVGICLLAGGSARAVPAGETGVTRIKRDSSEFQAGTPFLVRLQDGGLVVGRMRRATPDELILVTSMGEVTVSRDRIKEMTRIAAEDIHGGEFWSPDPGEMSTFLFPTASTLPRGKVSYKNYEILMHSVQLGVTDGVTLSAGGMLFPGGGGFSLGPKFRIYRNVEKRIEAAVGAHFFTGTGGNETVRMFFPYGVVSLGGSGRGRLNLGAGGFVVDGRGVSFLNLSGELRPAKRLKVMGEALVFRRCGKPYVFPTYGLRFLSEKLAFDLGFCNILGEGDLTPIGTPMISGAFRL